MPSCLLLLALGLLAGPLVRLNGQLITDSTSLASEGLKLGKQEHPFNQINENLCKKLKTDDEEENVKLVASWHEEVRNSTLFLFRKRKLRAMALELLTEPERQREAGTWCEGQRAEEFGRANKHEVMRHVGALRKQQPEGMLMCNRVFAIFFRQTLHHLELCAPLYQDNLRRAVESLNEFRLRDGERALKPLIGALQKSLAQQEDSFDLVHALRRQLVTGQLDSELIELTADSMKQFVRFGNKEQMDSEEVLEPIFDLLGAYIHQPCTYLTSNLGPILGPATLDLENLDDFWAGGEQLAHVAHSFRSYGPDVYKFWAMHLVCNRLLELDYGKLGEALREKVFASSS